MPDAISMALRVATTPVWVLWRGYMLLWWAFDDSSERAATRLSAKTTSAVDFAPPKFVEGGDSGQGRSFEVVDSGPPKHELPPPMPVPVGLLRGGFAGSLVLCTMFSVLTGGLAASAAMSAPRASALWLWGCSIILCSSVLIVRRVARRRWERPKGAVARARDACVNAAKGACAGVKQKFAFLGRKAAATVSRSKPDATSDAARVAQHVANPNPTPGVQPPKAESVVESNPYGAAAFRSAVKSLVPAVARGARGVLHPLRDRASKGFAWAADKSRPGSKAA